MPKDSQPIIYGIIAGSLVFILLGTFIWTFVLYYQKRQNRHIDDKIRLRKEFDEQLAQTQIEVQEETRKYLAADLHDNVGQLLSLTSVTLASINFDAPDRATVKVEDARELISKSIKELRRLSKVLYGEQLLQGGLAHTINEDIAWLAGKGYYDVRFEQAVSDAHLNNPTLNIFIYRLFQESINNIIKHASADTIAVRLSYERPCLLLIVEDNGQGFDTQDAKAQPGLD